MPVRRILLAGAAAAVVAAIIALPLCLRPPVAPLALEGSAPPIGVADPALALSFARVAMPDGQTSLVLVVGLADDHLDAIALAPDLAGPGDTAFAVLERLGRDRLIDLAQTGSPSRFDLGDVLPPIDGVRHVAAGTNFSDHADEVEVDPVFVFPKLSAPTPAVSTLAIPPGTLMDYEVELCLTADRPINGAESLGEAIVGVFLCGDTTDRATLLRTMNLDDPASGQGFPDAKSGEGRLPTGPILAIPADWRGFVADERMATLVDGILRQDGTGALMREDFDMLAARVGREAGRMFPYGDERIALLPDGALQPGQALLSGTPAGVLFRPPPPLEITCGIAAFCLGGFLQGVGPVDYVVERYIRRLNEADIYLQPGSVLEHASSRLGRIRIDLVAIEASD